MGFKPATLPMQIVAFFTELLLFLYLLIIVLVLHIVDNMSEDSL